MEVPPEKKPEDERFGKMLVRVGDLFGIPIYTWQDGRPELPQTEPRTLGDLGKQARMECVGDAGGLQLYSWAGNVPDIALHVDPSSIIVVESEEAQARLPERADAPMPSDGVPWERCGSALNCDPRFGWQCVGRRRPDAKYNRKGGRSACVFHVVGVPTKPTDCPKAEALGIFDPDDDDQGGPS